jgi:hypothetical protein
VRREANGPASPHCCTHHVALVPYLSENRLHNWEPTCIHHCAIAGGIVGMANFKLEQM